MVISRKADAPPHGGACSVPEKEDKRCILMDAMDASVANPRTVQAFLLAHSLHTIERCMDRILKAPVSGIILMRQLIAS
jgi:hypothetical protein